MEVERGRESMEANLKAHTAGEHKERPTTPVL